MSKLFSNENSQKLVDDKISDVYNAKIKIIRQKQELGPVPLIIEPDDTKYVHKLDNIVSCKHPPYPMMIRKRKTKPLSKKMKKIHNSLRSKTISKENPNCVKIQSLKNETSKQADKSGGKTQIYQCAQVHRASISDPEIRIGNVEVLPNKDNWMTFPDIKWRNAMSDESLFVAVTSNGNHFTDCSSSENSLSDNEEPCISNIRLRQTSFFPLTTNFIASRVSIFDKSVKELKKYGKRLSKLRIREVKPTASVISIALPDVSSFEQQAEIRKHRKKKYFEIPSSAEESSEDESHRSRHRQRHHHHHRDYNEREEKSSGDEDEDDEGELSEDKESSDENEFKYHVPESHRHRKRFRKTDEYTYETYNNDQQIENDEDSTRHHRKARSNNHYHRSDYKDDTNQDIDYEDDNDNYYSNDHHQRNKHKNRSKDKLYTHNSNNSDNEDNPDYNQSNKTPHSVTKEASGPRNIEAMTSKMEKDSPQFDDDLIPGILNCQNRFHRHRRYGNPRFESYLRHYNEHHRGKNKTKESKHHHRHHHHHHHHHELNYNVALIKVAEGMQTHKSHLRHQLQKHQSPRKREDSCGCHKEHSAHKHRNPVCSECSPANKSGVHFKEQDKIQKNDEHKLKLENRKDSKFKHWKNLKRANESDSSKKNENELNTNNRGNELRDPTKLANEQKNEIPKSIDKNKTWEGKELGDENSDKRQKSTAYEQIQQKYPRFPGLRIGVVRKSKETYLSEYEEVSVPLSEVKLPPAEASSTSLRETLKNLKTLLNVSESKKENEITKSQSHTMPRRQYSLMKLKKKGENRSGIKTVMRLWSVTHYKPHMWSGSRYENSWAMATSTSDENYNSILPARSYRPWVDDKNCRCIDAGVQVDKQLLRRITKHLNIFNRQNKCPRPTPIDRHTLNEEIIGIENLNRSRAASLQSRILHPLINRTKEASMQSPICQPLITNKHVESKNNETDTEGSNMQKCDESSFSDEPFIIIKPHTLRELLTLDLCKQQTKHDDTTSNAHSNSNVPPIENAEQNGTQCSCNQRQIPQLNNNNLNNKYGAKENIKEPECDNIMLSRKMATSANKNAMLTEPSDNNGHSNEGNGCCINKSKPYLEIRRKNGTQEDDFECPKPPKIFPSRGVSFNQKPKEYSYPQKNYTSGNTQSCDIEQSLSTEDMKNKAEECIKYAGKKCFCKKGPSRSEIQTQADICCCTPKKLAEEIHVPNCQSRNACSCTNFKEQKQFTSENNQEKQKKTNVDDSNQSFGCQCKIQQDIRKECIEVNESICDDVSEKKKKEECRKKCLCNKPSEQKKRKKINVECQCPSVKYTNKEIEKKCCCNHQTEKVQNNCIQQPKNDKRNIVAKKYECPSAIRSSDEFRECPYYQPKSKSLECFCKRDNAFKRRIRACKKVNVTCECPSANKTSESDKKKCLCRLQVTKSDECLNQNVFDKRNNDCKAKYSSKEKQKNICANKKCLCKQEPNLPPPDAKCEEEHNIYKEKKKCVCQQKFGPNSTDAKFEKKKCFCKPIPQYTNKCECLCKQKRESRNKMQMAKTIVVECPSASFSSEEIKKICIYEQLPCSPSTELKSHAQKQKQENKIVSGEATTEKNNCDKQTKRQHYEKSREIKINKNQSQENVNECIKKTSDTKMKRQRKIDTINALCKQNPVTDFTRNVKRIESSTSDRCNTIETARLQKISDHDQIIKDEKIIAFHNLEQVSGSISKHDIILPKINLKNHQLSMSVGCCPLSADTSSYSESGKIGYSYQNVSDTGDNISWLKKASKRMRFSMHIPKLSNSKRMAKLLSSKKHCKDLPTIKNATTQQQKIRNEPTDNVKYYTRLCYEQTKNFDNRSFTFGRERLRKLSVADCLSHQQQLPILNGPEINSSYPQCSYFSPMDRRVSSESSSYHVQEKKHYRQQHQNSHTELKRKVDCQCPVVWRPIRNNFPQTESSENQIKCCRDHKINDAGSQTNVEPEHSNTQIDSSGNLSVCLIDNYEFQAAVKDNILKIATKLSNFLKKKPVLVLSPSDENNQFPAYVRLDELKNMCYKRLSFDDLRTHLRKSMSEAMYCTKHVSAGFQTDDNNECHCIRKMDTNMCKHTANAQTSTKQPKGRNNQVFYFKQQCYGTQREKLSMPMREYSSESQPYITTQYSNKNLTPEIFKCNCVKARLKQTNELESRRVIDQIKETAHDNFSNYYPIENLKPQKCINLKSGKKNHKTENYTEIYRPQPKTKINSTSLLQSGNPVLKTCKYRNEKVTPNHGLKNEEHSNSSSYKNLKRDVKNLSSDCLQTKIKIEEILSKLQKKTCEKIQSLQRLSTQKQKKNKNHKDICSCVQNNLQSEKIICGKQPKNETRHFFEMQRQYHKEALNEDRKYRELCGKRSSSFSQRNHTLVNSSCSPQIYPKYDIKTKINSKQCLQPNMEQIEITKKDNCNCTQKSHDKDHNLRKQNISVECIVNKVPVDKKYQHENQTDINRRKEMKSIYSVQSLLHEKQSKDLSAEEHCNCGQGYLESGQRLDGQNCSDQERSFEEMQYKFFTQPLDEDKKYNEFLNEISNCAQTVNHFSRKPQMENEEKMFEIKTGSNSVQCVQSCEIARKDSCSCTQRRHVSDTRCKPRAIMKNMSVEDIVNNLAIRNQQQDMQERFNIKTEKDDCFCFERQLLSKKVIQGQQPKNAKNNFAEIQSKNYTQPLDEDRRYSTQCLQPHTIYRKTTRNDSNDGYVQEFQVKENFRKPHTKVKTISFENINEKTVSNKKENTKGCACKYPNRYTSNVEYKIRKQKPNYQNISIENTQTKYFEDETNAEKKHQKMLRKEICTCLEPIQMSESDKLVKEYYESKNTYPKGIIKNDNDDCTMLQNNNFEQQVDFYEKQRKISPNNMNIARLPSYDITKEQSELNLQKRHGALSRYDNYENIGIQNNINGPSISKKTEKDYKMPVYKSPKKTDYALQYKTQEKCNNDFRPLPFTLNKEKNYDSCSCTKANTFNTMLLDEKENKLVQTRYVNPELDESFTIDDNNDIYEQGSTMRVARRKHSSHKAPVNAIKIQNRMVDYKKHKKRKRPIKPLMTYDSFVFEKNSHEPEIAKYFSEKESKMQNARFEPQPNRFSHRAHERIPINDIYPIISDECYSENGSAITSMQNLGPIQQPTVAVFHKKNKPVQTRNIHPIVGHESFAPENSLFKPEPARCIKPQYRYNISEQQYFDTSKTQNRYQKQQPILVVNKKYKPVQKRNIYYHKQESEGRLHDLKNRFRQKLFTNENACRLDNEYQLPNLPYKEKRFATALGCHDWSLDSRKNRNKSKKRKRFSFNKKKSRKVRAAEKEIEEMLKNRHASDSYFGKSESTFLSKDYIKEHCPHLRMSQEDLDVFSIREFYPNVFLLGSK